MPNPCTNAPLRRSRPPMAVSGSLDSASASSRSTSLGAPLLPLRQLPLAGPNPVLTTA